MDRGRSESRFASVLWPLIRKRRDRLDGWNRHSAALVCLKKSASKTKPLVVLTIIPHILHFIVHSSTFLIAYIPRDCSLFELAYPTVPEPFHPGPLTC